MLAYMAEYDDDAVVEAVDRLHIASERRTEHHALALAAHTEAKLAALELVALGIPIGDVAALSGFSRQAIHAWGREAIEMAGGQS